MRHRKYTYQVIVVCPQCGVQAAHLIHTRDKFKSGITEHVKVKCLFCMDDDLRTMAWLLAENMKAGSAK